jgi:hypothetical protein
MNNFPQAGNWRSAVLLYRDQPSKGGSACKVRTFQILTAADSLDPLHISGRLGPLCYSQLHPVKISNTQFGVGSDH